MTDNLAPPTEQQAPTGHELALAMLAVQQELDTGIGKDSKNDQVRNKYVSLGAVLAHVVPVLTKHGLLLRQDYGPPEPGAVIIRTRIIHAATGQCDETMLRVPMPPSNKATTDAQMMGSASSYGRRYSIMTVLNLAQEDDDGHAAGRRQQAKQPPPSKPLTQQIEEACAYFAKQGVTRASLVEFLNMPPERWGQAEVNELRKNTSQIIDSYREHTDNPEPAE